MGQLAEYLVTYGGLSMARPLGIRIPLEFRNKVSYRIRQVMKPHVKEAGSLNAEAKEIAYNLDLVPETIRLWFEGQTLPTLYNLVRFADWYDVSIDYLLGRTAVKRLNESLRIVQGSRKVA